jgi:hypothetical protein
VNKCCDFAEGYFATGRAGIELMCFLRFGVQCGRFVMKRRTARQLVAQLSDLRRLARCSALRASASGGTMMQSPGEEMGPKALHGVQEGAEQESFRGAAHESHA